MICSLLMRYLHILGTILKVVFSEDKCSFRPIANETYLYAMKEIYEQICIRQNFHW